MVSAYFINIETNPEKLLLKALDRFIGCAVGGKVNLLYLMLVPQNPLTISLVILLGMYVMELGIHHTLVTRYGFFQAGIGLSIVLANADHSQIANVNNVLERLARMMLGSSMSLMVHLTIGRLRWRLGQTAT